MGFQAHRRESHGKITEAGEWLSDGGDAAKTVKGDHPVHGGDCEDSVRIVTCFFRDHPTRPSCSSIK